MRISILAGLLAVGTLAACATPVATVGVPTAPIVVTPPAPAVSDTARASARQVVNVEMARRLPGRNVAPYTQCVLDNATMAEVTDLAAQSGQTGAANAVASIVSRPATSACISRAAVA
ncbi:MAG: hypothetical protein DI498_13415 [Paracoccus denitrificans]|nr:MAG: hypothetical protein DI498_13415 [Paracoccus denitrificans]PZO83013.1 MAG: hypothetical protein DI633_13415 [Paracoccus denitrificans]